ncbi:uncharacterized protein TM35_000081750 [Trypanosoma theileri]|uniref:Uncharacterized protein n=1 Tax=Trypanosoma theileri TaxID=67003 RepID=A0A1X0P0B1_9TRYP|nr:uncharacterized protein TM35_000081750 [Trypanosoma theileri]ORC90377.1 hypothetical protein TM35_000081750 [Trypanosoma theileri]
MNGQRKYITTEPHIGRTGGVSITSLSSVSPNQRRTTVMKTTPVRMRKSQTSTSNSQSTAVTGVTFSSSSSSRGRPLGNVSTGSSSFSTKAAGVGSVNNHHDADNNDDLIKVSMKSSISLLDQTLWTEVEHLNMVTNRLRQRLSDIKHGVSDIKAAAPTSTSVETISKPTRTPRSLSHSLARRLTSSPVNKKQHEEQVKQQQQQKEKEKEQDRKLNKTSKISEEPPYVVSFTPGRQSSKKTPIRLRFTSPRKTPLRDNEDSVLTSLPSFQYKLASNQQTPKMKENVNKDSITDNGCEKEKHNDSSEMGTPICYATADDSSGITSKTINDSPVIVDLLNSTEKNLKIEERAVINDGTSPNTAKLMLLQGCLMSVEEELNSHVLSLLALQRDVLDAQKRGLVNANDPSIKALRLNIRDELNTCSIRTSTIASLRSKLLS